MWRNPAEDFTKVGVKYFARHKGEVNCCVFSPDCQILLTCSDDSRLHLWNARSGQLLAKASGHKGHRKCVETVSFSPDCKSLISGGWDKDAILWNCGALVRVLSGHNDAVQSSAVSRDSRLAATGSWDCTVRVWSLLTQELETTLEGHRGNVTSLCFSVSGMLASGSWDGTVRVWLPRAGSAIFVLEGCGAWVRTLAFSRDGLVLASAAENDMVRIWDMSTGKCIKCLQ
ncbi:hypothetical protein JZ751_016294, partial [Albula glossodonta]